MGGRRRTGTLRLVEQMAAQNLESLFARAETALRSRSLVDLDPELFAGLGQRELARVHEIAAHVIELEPGPWRPQLTVPDAGLGLIVLDGMLTRTVSLGGEVATEIAGAGDLVRPWEAAGTEDAIIPCEIGWTALTPTRLAVLGRRLALVAADCPGLVAALLERSGRRSRSQAVLTAIAHLKRIDVRVLVLLWHLAERWGRVTSDGVVVPLALTHVRIAQLVGAQRPSVTAALSRMSNRGLVQRTATRGYLLTAAAREQLAVLGRDGERAVVPLPAVCA